MQEQDGGEDESQRRKWIKQDSIQGPHVYHAEVLATQTLSLS